MTVNHVREVAGHTVVTVDDGCPPGEHRRDELCAFQTVATLAPAEPMRWHYGPTDTDPNPGSMWHYGCGGEVMLFDGHAVCGCGAQVCESPADCEDDDCEYRGGGGAT